MTTVRTQKSGDQLAFGDWLAPGELLDVAAELLFVHAYPASADRSRDNDGTHVQLVAREQGKASTYADIVSGSTLFDLATDEDLAALQVQAEREKLADELRVLATMILNPAMPVPQYGIALYGSFKTPAEVRAAAEVFSLPVESREPNKGIQTAEWPLDRKSYESGVHLHWLTIADEPEPVDEHFESGGWKGEEPGSCGVECKCGVTYDGFDSLAEASEFLARHVADPSGHDYGRADTAEAEDPTRPGVREPMHTGGVTEVGLVDETEDPFDAQNQAGRGVSW